MPCLFQTKLVELYSFCILLLIVALRSKYIFTAVESGEAVGYSSYFNGVNRIGDCSSSRATKQHYSSIEASIARDTIER